MRDIANQRAASTTHNADSAHTASVPAPVSYTHLDVYKRQIETLTPSDPDYDAIMAGTVGLSLGGGLLIGLLSIAIGAAVQGVVAANLRIAVLGEKPKLSVVWRQVKPAFWRILGYTLLPVSYTHLDVYKRQVSRRTSISLPSRTPGRVSVPACRPTRYLIVATTSSSVSTESVMGASMPSMSLIHI